MKRLAAACLLTVLWACAVRADIIYFKDGLKTVCQESAWEEDDRIRCEYGGWVITYKKSDVLRILKTTRPKPQPKSKPKAEVSKKNEPAQRITKNISPPKAGSTAFYDPRRPYPYRTDKNIKHKSYHQAIQALARKYERPTEWIKANMGDTNDLDEIHRNLAGQNSDQAGHAVEHPVNNKAKQPADNETEQPADYKAKQPGGNNAEQPGNKKAEIDFYNPRRPFPYRTSASAKHKRFRAAIRTLAHKYNRSPEWVQQHMGQTNDLTEIHLNLGQRRSAESLE